MDEKVILAIESSCDETAVAVVRKRKVLSNIIYSQIAEHAKYGGVVPEIASRRHIEVISQTVEEAIAQAGITKRQIDAVAVTMGPGLVGALLSAVSFGKAYAYALGCSLLGVNHMDGHISANYIDTQLKPPYVCLVVSGGHTQLLDVQGYGQYRLLGETRDDAAGEAFDKGARVLGLGYPGGPMIQKAAEQGSNSAYSFTKPKVPEFAFSFSGMKTALTVLCGKTDVQTQVNDLAASFQEAIVDILVEKSFAALQFLGTKTLALAGGVSANKRLREKMQQRAQQENVVLYIPPLSLCTDNAAMIGCAAYYQWRKSNFAPTLDLRLNAVPNLQTEEFDEVKT